MDNPYQQVKYQGEAPNQQLLPSTQHNPYSQNTANLPPSPSPPVETGPDAQLAYQEDYVDFASDANKLHSKKSSCHWQAFIATLLLVGGVTSGLILYINGIIQIGAMAGIMGGSYVLYLMVGCICNKLGSYLRNIDQGQNFQKYYEWIRNTPGYFWFQAVCYHYETRHHTRRVTDSNGKSRTQHYTTTEKVVTHRATENLSPRYTLDESGPIDRIRAQTNIVFIHFRIIHRFSDWQSQQNFNNFFSGFKMRHSRDVHQDFSYGYKIKDLVERKAFHAGELKCSYNLWFNVCGLLGLLWPFSLCMQSKISRFDVVSMKAVTI